MKRLGCVKYLNARPLIHGWPGKVVFDHPAALCDRLARGELDVALVSSFEFLRNPIYRIVDDVSISSDGPVYSVIVAYEGDTPLPGIELDQASVTSIALLKCIVHERGEKLHSINALPDYLAPLAPSHSRLLIGDQAIRFRQRFGERYRYWDLGEEWKRMLDVPFVFALWLVRPETGTGVQALADTLRALRYANLRDVDRMVAEVREFDHDFCGRYFREHLRFSFGEKEKESLRTFANLCAQLGLIPKRELALDLV
jgi:chorismate dehydratase